MFLDTFIGMTLSQASPLLPIVIKKIKKILPGAPVGESVDPCCASEAAPGEVDTKEPAQNTYGTWYWNCSGLSQFTHQSNQSNSGKSEGRVEQNTKSYFL